MKQTNHTQRTFGKKLGISPNYLSNIITGSRDCTLKLAIKIERLTKGAVPHDFWVRNDPDMPPPYKNKSRIATKTATE